MMNEIKTGMPFPDKSKNLWNILYCEKIRSQKGFTLIEIVVTLVLVGILAALGGFGIVQAVKGYIAVKGKLGDNAEGTISAAMSR